MNWHLLTLTEITKVLNTRATGISETDAEVRIQEHGPNEIEEQKRKSVWQMLLHQLTDFMVLVLIAASIISGLLGDVTDTIIILLIVALNTIIGFVQEYRAEKAMEALKKMAASVARVVREGKQKDIPASQLVPGDLVLLEAGNLLPADVRFNECFSLKVDESALTGESHHVDKIAVELEDGEYTLGDRTNMGYKGTHVTHGRGSGYVVATGMNTELGQIARMIQKDDTETPLQKRLAAFGKKLAVIIFIICIVIFGLGVLRGEAVLHMLLTSISLAVAAIPEALPAVVTISLALGARRMVKQNVLIRRLPAVEALGSVTYICSDKTGTLTLNKMTVQQLVETDAGTQFSELPKDDLIFIALSLNNDVTKTEAGIFTGESTEVALAEYAAGKGFERSEMEKSFPRVAEIPFDSHRKCMTTVHTFGVKYLSITKGATDVLLKKVAASQQQNISQWQNQIDEMASNGMRVLGYAAKILDALPENISPEYMEKDLVFLGFAGLMDPPRPEVKAAIDECRQAGIQPVMITGDHPLTAKAIAKSIGIVQSNDDLTLTGAELSQISMEEFESKVEHVKVYARVNPEQKLNIVKALQDKNQFVSMTGDGVNDAPALKNANIGVAMGINGTEVSKEAAHMILLDDNFVSIVKAVREGRVIFDNIKKFIKYTMTSNSGEILVILLAPFFGLPVPLLPVHILWINLVTDGLPGITLTAEPGEKDVMSRPPRAPGESIFSDMSAHILWVGFLMGIVSIAVQAYTINKPDYHWQTMVFAVLCFSQMGHVLAIRSNTQSLFSQGIFSNKPLLGAVLLTFLLQLATIYIPFLNPIFKTEALSLKELVIVLAVSSIVFWAVEAEKWWKRRRQ
ncbi:MAG: cation-translocating P-type ATPase [Chitinophagales bacterium]|nr:cation-translocating P-type ATPase [Chitinophagales bacterium]